MNKSLLVALALGSVLSACSSSPSDLRPSQKVSLDQVPPGTRENDAINGVLRKEGEDRADVMPNHDEHKNDIGGHDQVQPNDKTTDAAQVENHE